MKKTTNFLSLICLVLALSFTVSCDDDEDDCGFGAVTEAKKNFESAAAAYSTDSSITNCNTLETAISEYNTAANAIDTDCLNEQDATNFIAWSIEVAVTSPSC